MGWNFKVFVMGGIVKKIFVRLLWTCCCGVFVELLGNCCCRVFVVVKLLL